MWTLKSGRSWSTKRKRWRGSTSRSSTEVKSQYYLSYLDPTAINCIAKIAESFPSGSKVSSWALIGSSLSIVPHIFCRIGSFGPCLIYVGVCACHYMIITLYFYEKELSNQGEPHDRSPQTIQASAAVHKQATQRQRNQKRAVRALT